jgi:hypothetical protein
MVGLNLRLKKYATESVEEIPAIRRLEMLLKSGMYAIEFINP